MDRKRLAGFALALGLVALAGCAEPPPPQIAAAPPAPVALVPVPVPVPVVEPVVVHHMARRPAPVRHVVTTRHWVRRVHSVETRYVWTPGCGSVANPCTLQRVSVPIQ